MAHNGQGPLIAITSDEKCPTNLHVGQSDEGMTPVYFKLTKTSTDMHTTLGWRLNRASGMPGKHPIN